MDKKPEREIQAKIGDKNKTFRAPGKSKTRKGGLGKNGLPDEPKTRSGERRVEKG